MKPLPYIGVTGFMHADEVQAALDALPDCGRRLMVGVLASEKTLRGERNKYPRRYPRVEDIAGIFLDDPRCLNLVHYASDRDDLLWPLDRAMQLGGRWCHGVQVNFPWPTPASLEAFRTLHPSARVVLQVGPRALESATSAAEVVGRLHHYVAIQAITDVLLDTSGGRGTPLESGRVAGLVDAVRRAYPAIGVGVAGGLCAEALSAVADLLRAGVSIDAEGRLRDDADGGGNLQLDKLRAYLAVAGVLLTAER